MKPYIGVLMWIWIGLMNIHQFAYQASTFPVAFAIAVPTLAGTLFFSERRKFPFERETWILIILLLWFAITTYFALEPQRALRGFEKVWKIYLMTIVSLLLFQDHKKLKLYFWVIAISVAFFSVKGAIFTILTKGQYIIFGPPRSFIEDNNALALAELMVMPILVYLAKEEKHIWLRRLLYFISALMIFAVIFSYSRGALLALFSLSIFFIFFVSKKKLLPIVLLIVIGIIGMPFIPQKWFDRMETIRSYQEDRSAMGRINAWNFAYNLSKDRPILGGGFRVFTQKVFLEYAPDPYDVHDSHSIYFQMLAEQGFPGLIMFLALLLSSYFSLNKIKRIAIHVESLDWVKNYCIMLQLSIVAYCIGGAFLGLAYFDLFYYIVAAVIILKTMVREELTTIPMS
jgi:probable O-glycosylation ligase (exosortase A-associated)